MSAAIQDFANQTTSAISTLSTLLKEHEKAMSLLDIEISSQNIDSSQDSDSKYRLMLSNQKRNLLEKNCEQIQTNISQAEIISQMLKYISELESQKTKNEEKTKIIYLDALKMGEQLDDMRQQLETAQDRIITLEEENSHLKYINETIKKINVVEQLSTASTDSHLNGLKESLNDAPKRDSIVSISNNHSADMMMDETQEGRLVTTQREGSKASFELSEDTEKQIKIINDYTSHGSYTIAVNLCNKSLKDLENCGDNPQLSLDRAAMLSTLAMLYRDTDTPDKSIPLLMEALEIKKSVFGADHLGVALIANNLAILYSKIQEYAEAESFCRMALQVKEKALGTESQEVANQLTNLGLICLNERKYEDAEFHFLRALNIYQEESGAKDKNVLKTTSELGNCYFKQGKMAEAETLFKKVISAGDEIQASGDHEGWKNLIPTLQYTLNYLKDFYLVAGNKDMANNVEMRLQKLKGTHRGSYMSRLPTGNQSSLPRRQRNTLSALQTGRQLNKSPTPGSMLPQRSASRAGILSNNVLSVRAKIKEDRNGTPTPPPHNPPV